MTCLDAWLRQHDPTQKATGQSPEMGRHINALLDESIEQVEADERQRIAPQCYQGSLGRHATVAHQESEQAPVDAEDGAGGTSADHERIPGDAADTPQ